MRQRVSRLLLAFFMCVGSSCEEPLFTPDPSDDRVAIFQQLWDDYNKNYPSFEVRKINWSEVYGIYQPQAAAATTDAELFVVLGNMLRTLRDGHADIRSPSLYMNYPIMEGYRDNFISIENMRSRLQPTSIQGNRTILSGFLPDNIGYIFIGSWGAAEQEYAIIEPILQRMINARGIIIDVRTNGGGSSLNADRVMGRFTDVRRQGTFIRFKVGPGRDDLSDFVPTYFEPVEGIRMPAVPIAILTSRASYSASEYFVTSMKVMPQVFTVGDTTGGGSSSPVWRELPNDWHYRLPRWLQYNTSKETYEGKGIYPDFPVWISELDESRGTDRILNLAVEKLK